MSGSDYTRTPNYNLYKPVSNADVDVWGDHLNANADTLDSLIHSIQITAGVSAFNTRTGAVTLTSADVTTALTYTPYNVTNPAGYVTASGAATAAPVQSVATRTGAVVLTHTDITDWAATLAPYAPLASPALTGNPTAPTPAPGDADTSIATTAFVQAAVAPALNDAGRNLLHNSLFNVAQRGAGPFATSGFTLDRWSLAASLDTLSFIQSTLTDADRTAIGDEAAKACLTGVVVGNAAAGSYTFLTQSIEDVRRLGGKTVTVSFWAKAASGTPKLGVNIQQAFGTGGSPSTGVWVTPTGQAFTLSTAWQRFTATFAVTSTTGKTIGTNNDSSTGLSFWWSSGATNNAVAGNIGVQNTTMLVWGVQLEIGSVATPLEKPDPQQDLAKCQRFYQQGTMNFAAYALAGGATYATVTLPVLMRSTPTITPVGNGSTNISSQTFSGNNAAAWAAGVATATGAFFIGTNFTASADL